MYEEEAADEDYSQVITVSQLISKLPKLATSGLFIRIDESEGKIHTMDNQGNESIFDVFEEYIF